VDAGQSAYFTVFLLKNTPMQALWMLLACLAFCVMAACVKVASAYFNSFELVAYRGLIGMLVMAVLARARGIDLLATKRPGMHLWRAAIGVFSLLAWFYSLAHLPLATAMTLNYMSGLWVAFFVVCGAVLARMRSPKHLKSQVFWAQQGPLLLMLFVGFAGVLLILQPTVNPQDAAAGLIGLLSGFTAGLAYMQVKALGVLGEPEERTVFYFAVGSFLVGLLGLPFASVSIWPGWQGLWLLPVGLLASLGQWAMTRAYAQGATLLVANLQYAGVVFAALLGWVGFEEKLSLLAWGGMALVIGSGLGAALLRARAARLEPLPEAVQ
jgi:S-adenosylmethionine uptake transporter